MMKRKMLLIIWLTGLPLVSHVYGQTPGGEQQSGNAIVMVERAIELIEAGDLNNASRLLQEAAVIKPDLELLSLGNGLLLAAGRQDLQAIPNLETYNLSKAGRADYRGFAAVGEIYIRNRKYNLARGVLEKARDLAPPKEDDRAVRAEISARLAESLVRLDRPRLAIRELKEAQAGSVDDPATQLLICKLAVTVKESVVANEAADNAINGFNQELRLNPFRRTSYVQLIECFEVMIEQAAQELAQAPDDATAFLRTARLLRELGTLERRLKLVDARDLVMQAMEVGDATTDKLLLMAELEAELGGIEQARARIEEILKQDAENARALQLQQGLPALGASSAFGR